ncbi:hypothetical protein GGU11DRAFT_80038 [Lentinula aff. detonsa]|nr:hypothetical protein GGU11DRAFT_80038 [Lentinula aff. detonsa]
MKPLRSRCLVLILHPGAGVLRGTCCQMVVLFRDTDQPDRVIDVGRWTLGAHLTTEHRTQSQIRSLRLGNRSIHDNTFSSFTWKIEDTTFQLPASMSLFYPSMKYWIGLGKNKAHIQRLMDEGGLQEGIFAVDMLIAELCGQACEIWPNARHIVPVNHRSFRTSLQCIGLADNTHRSNRKLPTIEEIQLSRVQTAERHFTIFWK